MTRKDWIVGALIFGGSAAACLGSLYTWTARGGDDNWNNTENWSGGDPWAQCGSPCTTNDDALFPAGADGLYVGLITEQIDDLTINSSR
ncbi:MAG TPA: hypothetical protein PKK06_17020, partial [Phycisphaerae bacterium]|nr:hypothetical protein [Phycisphaerae bacterium]